MTKIKLCGLSRPQDIEAANLLMPDYVGFVFAPASRRYVEADKAMSLRALLHPDILTVGVFVKEEPERVAGLLERGVIQLAQLHGGEDEEYICRLRDLTEKPIIKAFHVESEKSLTEINECTADFVLLDGPAGGSGKSFDWSLLRDVKRPYFLAGGLDGDNVEEAIQKLSPYGVDVSSGIENPKGKDAEKMRKFVAAVRRTKGQH